MLAMAKARQLATEGFETLLVCFNSPLARVLADETRDVAERTGHLHVSTFHQLAEDLAREADTLPAEAGAGDPGVVRGRRCREALDDAIGKLGPRYHAIVVDEGQDFDAGWLASLEGLLYGGKQDVLYVFHDPAQAVFRADQTGELGLTDYPLDFNCRNAQPIHALIEPFAKGGLSSMARRQDGRPVELIAADVDSEADRGAAQGAPSAGRDARASRPARSPVISGLGLEHSAVWKQRRYGNQVLWNGAVGDDGRSLGLAAGRRPGAAARTSSCASRSAASRAWNGRSSCCWRSPGTTRNGWTGCCTSGRHGRGSTWWSSRRWRCCGGWSGRTRRSNGGVPRCVAAPTVPHSCHSRGRVSADERGSSGTSDLGGSGPRP